MRPQPKPFLAWLLAVSLLVVGRPERAAAGPLSTNAWQYTLLPGSQLSDSCDICGRPTLLAPLRGTFTLQPAGCDPLLCHYAWLNVRLEGGNGAGTSYFLEGQGTYEIRGEVSLLQNLTLALYTDPGHTNALRYFTNVTAKVEQLWPMIHISLDETNPTFVQHLRLEIFAAPMREVWFSTRTGFTDGFWHAPTNRVSAGDLVASTGRVVKTHERLGGTLGVMPPAPDLGLKDVDVLPGGEIAFSIDQDIFSETLGPLHAGDLVSDHGHLLATNAQLLAAFDPEPTTGDVGLAALQVLDGGEFFFSVQTNFLSRKLGRMIGPGDLLSSHGSIVRSNAELVARFFPTEPAKDYGLAAVYLWPSGEIWFATQSGFAGTNGQVYLGGDLLSDQGYVVYRNLDLLLPFAPVEDVSNFGLDAVFVITDVTPPPAGKAISAVVDPGTGNVTVHYTGDSKAWQLERAPALGGPWQAAGDIGTDPVVVDMGAARGVSSRFYRFHQW